MRSIPLRGIREALDRRLRDATHDGSATFLPSIRRRGVGDRVVERVDRERRRAREQIDRRGKKSGSDRRAPATSHRMDLQRDGELYVRGTLPAEMVAVVGARASDPYGLALARQLGRELAARGIAVVSGGAEGCDHAAHVGALEAGGRTVVVLPAGHDHPYPRRHVPLYERIVAEGGAVVSPFPPEATVARSRFLARNRVIAELASGVIVARARARSGSLSTARAAKALGKRVAAVPGAIGEALSEGCHLLLDEGAVPMVAPRSLDRWLGRGTRSRPWPVFARGQAAPWGEAMEAQPETARPIAQHAAASAILKEVRAEPGLDLDMIAMRTGTPISALAEVVLDLEIEGVLERWPGGRYHPGARQGD